MTRTRDQLEQATAEAEAWLGSLDPATTPADDITDLRAIAQVVDVLARDEARLTEAVTAARVNGRSWGMIARAHEGVCPSCGGKRPPDPHPKPKPPPPPPPRPRGQAS